MATINSKSWHYRLVKLFDRVSREETPIRGPFQYWFGIVPLYVFWTLVMGAFLGFFVFGLLLFAYNAVGALIRDPLDTILATGGFLGAVLALSMAALLLIFIIAALGERISKQMLKVTIK